MDVTGNWVLDIPLPALKDSQRDQTPVKAEHSEVGLSILFPRFCLADLRFAIILSIHYGADTGANPELHKEEANADNKSRQPSLCPDRQTHIQTRTNRYKELTEQGQLWGCWWVVFFMTELQSWGLWSWVPTWGHLTEKKKISVSVKFRVVSVDISFHPLNETVSLLSVDEFK